MKKRIVLSSFLWILFLTFFCAIRTEAADLTVETGSFITLSDYNMTNGTGYTKTWSSSNTSIASTISNRTTCSVYGKRPGTVTITCFTNSWVSIPYFQWTGPYASDGYWTTRTTYSYTTRYYTVKVVNALQSIHFSNSNISIETGKTTNLELIKQPADGLLKSIQYSSNNPSVADIDTEGKVSAKKQGTAIITATANNKHVASCTITVNKQDNSNKNTSSNNKEKKSLTGKIFFNKKKLSLCIGEKAQLNASLDGKQVTPSYKSTNKKKVTVNKNGVITAKSCGTTQIIAKLSNGKKATCTVKVVPQKVINVTSAVKKNKVLLKWNKLKKISGYKLYRATKVDGKYKAIKTITSRKNKVLLKKQKKGMYFYKICAYKKMDGKMYLGKSSEILYVTV